MTGGTAKPPLVRANDRPDERLGRHPLNPDSEMHYVSLGDEAGLERIGVHLVRVPPGKESCIYHRHVEEEEWVYILRGRAVADIDGNQYEVGPGDFMGFPTPSVGHHLRNPFDEDLLFLVGGERKGTEVAEFPDLRKHLVRIGGQAWMVDEEDLQAFPIPEK